MTEAAQPTQPIFSIGGRWTLILCRPLVIFAFSSLVPVLPAISKHFASTPNADVVVRMLITALVFMTTLATVSATLIGMVVFGGGLGLLAPNLYAVAADDIPELRARRNGMARAGCYRHALFA